MTHQEPPSTISKAMRAVGRAVQHTIGEINGARKRKHSEFDHTNVRKTNIKFEDVVLAKPKNPLEIPEILQRLGRYLTLSSKAKSTRVSKMWHNSIELEVCKEIRIFSYGQNDGFYLEVEGKFVPWVSLQDYRDEEYIVEMGLPRGISHINIRSLRQRSHYHALSAVEVWAKLKELPNIRHFNLNGVELAYNLIPEFLDVCKGVEVLKMSSCSIPAPLSTRERIVTETHITGEVSKYGRLLECNVPNSQMTEIESLTIKDARQMDVAGICARCPHLKKLIIEQSDACVIKGDSLETRMEDLRMVIDSGMLPELKVLDIQMSTVDCRPEEVLFQSISRLGKLHTLKINRRQFYSGIDRNGVVTWKSS